MAKLKKGDRVQLTDPHNDDTYEVVRTDGEKVTIDVDGREVAVTEEVLEKAEDD